ncbi:uncharacterized protein LOC132304339 [Cornus florida]|uniref:uncharacterized protein LOC132304339 n=1 Tax=Cornus florida TaxID=4283 RepID=UPI002896DFFC|nr:uncharacterized protein LOC132304339 [Cornus florida]XP_059657960.1 uncharacterized protein LOC132304339 [Cornus florida]XP_059657961.1 uncharacterized protein LOC132304339 [Cornus florida]XP_059657962.1 uncharacterized protein LOC132304339 [Cornus florida]
MAMDMPEEEKKIQDELRLAILLADRVINSAQVAESSKLECRELAMLAERLRQMLGSAVQLAESTQPLYERPIRRIVADVTKNLERALTLARRCRRGCVLRLVFAITTAADFRKASNFLESSIADLNWVYSVFDSEEGGTLLSLPPIAQNDPILSWVWSYIASLQMGHLRNRTDAANELASLAGDNDRNKTLIVEEGGIVPLLRLLKEGISADAQIAASAALCKLCTDRHRARLIAKELAVPMIVKVLGDSPMRVQVWVSNLVSRMAEMDSDVQEELGRENVIRLLVTLLSVDTDLNDDPKLQSGNTGLHSLVQINKELVKNTFNQSHHSNFSSSSSFLSVNHKKDKRNVEAPELKLKLKISCSEALWKLSKGSLLNSRKITEAKGLLCLAKIIEQEKGDLQINCLMTVMELTAVAEFNADLRRVAFKPNSPAAKAVLDQLLRVINEETSPRLLLPTVKSIGCLARTFPAKETRIVLHLVAQLSHRNAEVATEAAIALGKFVLPDNFNCVEHSKVIVEFDGVPRLMNLLRTSDRRRVHELVLLCYLAFHCGNSKVFEQERTLKFLEEKARSPLAQHPEMKQLFFKAMDRLTLYENGRTHA